LKEVSWGTRNMQDKIKAIGDRRKHLLQGGGEKELERQHQQGRLTARERLTRLFDEGSFREIDLWIRAIRTEFDIDDRDLPAEAVITGFGKIHGRTTYAYIHGFTVVGGTMSSGQDHKVTRLMEMAMDAKVPYVGIVDSGGVRVHDLFGRPAFRPIQAGRLGIGGTTGIFAAPSVASGVIPQITVMLGPCYAGSAYSPHWLTS
jgi:acetyl-CoA carboxylase carboxyltransferase component